MTTVWEWVKPRTHWFYLAAMLAIAGASFANGDIVGGAITAACGVVIFALLWGLRREEPKPFEFPPELLEAAEVLRPAPEALADHIAENPNCSLCKGMGWIK